LCAAWHRRGQPHTPNRKGCACMHTMHSMLCCWALTIGPLLSPSLTHQLVFLPLHHSPSPWPCLPPGPATHRCVCAAQGVPRCIDGPGCGSPPVQPISVCPEAQVQPRVEACHDTKATNSHRPGHRAAQIAQPLHCTQGVGPANVLWVCCTCPQGSQADSSSSSSST
jgi:hypothetical protein